MIYYHSNYGQDRIFQESLSNISKHAGATLVTIRINRHHNYLHFLVADNGRGFNLADVMGKVSNTRGMGYRTGGLGTRVSFIQPAENLPLNSGSSEFGTISAAGERL